MYKFNPPYAIIGGVGPDPGGTASISRQLGPRFADYEFPHEREAREKAEREIQQKLDEAVRTLK